MSTQAPAGPRGHCGSSRSHLVPGLSSWGGMSVTEVIDVCLGANSLLHRAPSPVCDTTAPGHITEHREDLSFVCV